MRSSGTGAFVALASFLLFAATAAAQSDADLYVSKVAPASGAPGANITFTVTVGNLGPNDALSANLADTLPTNTTFVSELQTSGPTFTCSTPSVGAAGGSVACSIATFPAGQTATFDITVNAPLASAGSIAINSATVSSETPDANSENNSSVAGTQITGGNSADVSITKTGPQSAPPNTDVSYTITVHNFGPNDATTVSWTDTLPSSIPAGTTMTFVSFNQNSGPAFNCGVPAATTTCSIGTLASGATATFTLVGHIPNNAAVGATYTNQANLTSDNDPNPDNDTSATTVLVSSADVGVIKSGPATAIAGVAYSYTITLSNGGPDTANDTSFNDTLPAGLVFVSLVQDTGPAATCSTPPANSGGIVACSISLLGNGAGAQFTLTVKPLPGVANGTVVSNTATASTSSADTNASNNSSTAATTVSTSADLSIVKSGSTTVTAGTNLSYSITVANAGPSDAASASWTDVLPAGTTFVSLVQNTGPAFTCTTGATVQCSIASLTSGAGATFTLVVMVTPSTTGTIANTATVASTTPDANSGNNAGTSATTVLVSADVSVTKAAPATVAAGAPLAYSITVTNLGPSSAASVSLSDAIPANTTFASLSQSTGPAFSCTTPPAGGTGNVTCSVATLNGGASATFTLTVVVGAAVPKTTAITNTATVSTTSTDPNPANNSASTTSTVADSIPTLSSWSLLALALALAALALMKMR